MFILYFKNDDNKCIKIAERSTIEGCFKAMYNYLIKLNYRSYYQRYYYRPNRISIDFGSHYESFYIIKENNVDFKNEYEDYLKESDYKLNNQSYKNKIKDNLKKKKLLMNMLLDLYDQYDSMTDGETKKIIKEFIKQKEKKLGEILNG